MPAEWEPHAATWLSWPHRLATWPGKFEPIPHLYVQLVRTLAAVEAVHVLAGGHPMLQARALLAGIANVTLHEIATDDAWIRDSGPTFLVGPPGSPPTLIDWGYNAWGGKYPPYANDDALGRLIARETGRICHEPDMILEGGAIDVDGRGTLLTTEECLLNPNRNPQLSRGQIERRLYEFLGARKVLWLGRGIAGDDTDGHIDELARFVGPRTVVAAVEENPRDENFASLDENLRRLRSFTDADDQPLEVVPLPMPRPIVYDGQRLPASYCNFYLANGIAVVPQFGDPADAEAVEILGGVLKDRRIVPLPARDLVWGLGAFHCITQQEPAGG
ncbi:MAG TPA: agmatine deiminase family protein [Pirellulales bacterium]|nr:agmatine deiminase family protein [Pirellulales bacterium]